MAEPDSSEDKKQALRKVGPGRPALRCALAVIPFALLAIGFGPGLASACLANLGAIRLLRGYQDASPAELGAAAGLLGKACALDDANRSARRLLGQDQGWQGDYASARESLSYVLQTSSQDTLTYYWRGVVNFDDARYEQAGEDWRQAGFLEYKLQMLRELASDLSGQGDWEAAETELHTAVQLEPMNPSGYYSLGGLYWGMPGREADAIAAFQSGIDLDHSDSFYRFWSEGRLRLLEKQWALAATALEMAARANPEHRDALTQWGYACWRDGQTERAGTILESVVARWPDYLEPYLYLSAIAGERGDRQRAVLYLLDYLAVGPDSARACDALVLLLSGWHDPQWIEWTQNEAAQVAPGSTSCASRLAQLLGSLQK